VPPGRIPAGLVSSADQLLRRLVATDASWGLIALQGRVCQGWSRRPAPMPTVAASLTTTGHIRQDHRQAGRPTQVGHSAKRCVSEPQPRSTPAVKLSMGRGSFPWSDRCGLIIRRIPYGRTGDARPQSSRPASTTLIQFGFVAAQS
jgi:hypothetical protein